MNNLNDTLPSMMHRATENLEPVTTDLLDRTVQQGLRLRRRRTAVLSVSGAGAVLATAGLVAGGIQLLGSPSEASVAGTPVPIVAPKAATKPTTKPAVVTPQQTLATLRRLISGQGRTLTKPTARGSEKDGFLAASYVVDDGNGTSFIEVLVAGGGMQAPCGTGAAASGCTTNPDGSTMYSATGEPEYADGRQDREGIVANRVELQLPDGRYIGLTNYNGPAEKGTVHTRPEPVFTTAQLVTMARSKAWKFPAYTAPKPSGFKVKTK